MLNRFEATIAVATLQQLDAISQDTWKQHGLQLLRDGDATHIAEMIEARRVAIRQHTGMKTVAPLPLRRSQRAPDPSESKCRRRRLAYSGPHPPNLAQWFTESQNAVLKVIGDEVAAKGECRLCVDQIAAIAGCSRATVQRATRAARMRGLITIEERRCSPTKNLPSIIRIISKEWLRWLEGGYGGRRTTPRCGIRPAAAKTDAPRILGLQNATQHEWSKVLCGEEWKPTPANQKEVVQPAARSNHSYHKKLRAGLLTLPLESAGCRRSVEPS